MPIYLGSKKLSDLVINKANVSEVYYGKILKFTKTISATLTAEAIRILYTGSSTCNDKFTVTPSPSSGIKTPYYFYIDGSLSTSVYNYMSVRPSSLEVGSYVSKTVYAVVNWSNGKSVESNHITAYWYNPDFGFEATLSSSNLFSVGLYADDYKFIPSYYEDVDISFVIYVKKSITATTWSIWSKTEYSLSEQLNAGDYRAAYAEVTIKFDKGGTYTFTSDPHEINNCTVKYYFKPTYSGTFDGSLPYSGTQTFTKGQSIFIGSSTAMYENVVETRDESSNTAYIFLSDIDTLVDLSDINLGSMAGTSCKAHFRYEITRWDDSASTSTYDNATKYTISKDLTLYSYSGGRKELIKYSDWVTITKKAVLPSTVTSKTTVGTMSREVSYYLLDDTKYSPGDTVSLIFPADAGEEQGGVANAYTFDCKLVALTATISNGGTYRHSGLAATITVTPNNTEIKNVTFTIKYGSTTETKDNGTSTTLSYTHTPESGNYQRVNFTAVVTWNDGTTYTTDSTYVYYYKPSITDLTYTSVTTSSITLSTTITNAYGYRSGYSTTSYVIYKYRRRASTSASWSDWIDLTKTEYTGANKTITQSQSSISSNKVRQYLARIYDYDSYGDQFTARTAYYSYTFG